MKKMKAWVCYTLFSPEIFRIRRFFELILITLFVSTTVFSANDLSEKTRVNINAENILLKDLIHMIEEQTDYLFVYNNSLDLTQKISVSVTDAPVDKILSNIFDKHNILHAITGNNIMLLKKEESQLVAQPGKTITGKVLDQEGYPLIGANIILKERKTGVITNQDGFYTILVEKGQTLQFSYIGYETREIKIEDQTEITIQLMEDNLMLDELVIVGYGTQKKGNIATSITSIKSEALQNRPIQTIGETLQGQVAGLNITGSSKPGSTPSIQLRGTTSLNNSGGPLVLIDGVPGDFNYLNSEDIESVNVLKDAASAAIYGSRAANGVLLITTKRGKTGKPKFRYNGSFGVNTPTHLPKTVSSATYARVINEAEQNMGRTIIWNDNDIALFENGTDPDRYPNTDWYSLVIENSLTTRHSIEASGGTDVVKYILSGGFDKQTGVFPNNTMDVFNVRSATDIQISRKFNISFDMRYQVRKLDELRGFEDAFKELYAANPTMVAYYQDGSYGYNAGFFINPLVSIFEGGTKLNDRHDATGIFKFDYEIMDGLVFSGLANANYVFSNTSDRERKRTYTSLYTDEVIEKGDNTLTERRDSKTYYNLQALLNYKKKYKDHSIDALLLYQQENEKSNWISANRTGYPTDLVWVLNAGSKENWSNDGKAEHWAISSVIGRLIYDYQDKYILTASFRSDASSRFAKGYRWSTFPSFAAAWRISGESFMDETRHILDDLKIRVSWGQTGATTGLGLYPSYTTIAMDGVVLNNSYMQTAKISQIGNPEIGWERTNMLNIGLDFTLLHGRLGFVGEYYIKKTKDILIGLPVPMEYGFGKPNVNIGKLQNKGWELSLRWNDRIKDVTYGVSANISDNRNKVLDLADTSPWIDGNRYTIEGKPFKSYYGLESMGLFQTDTEVANAPFQNSYTAAGDVRYKNQNDDDIIDANDRVIIGDPYPHYIFGLNLNATYKGFDLSMLFQGIGKKDMILNDATIRPLSDSSIFEHQMDYWSKDNPDAKYPRILNSSDSNTNYQVSDYWKFNSGYLRMKNLQFGYSLPYKVISQAGFSQVRLYFSANNLFTISNFITGFDPEIGSASTYPFSRTYSFGLNVQF